ncbi:TPA: cobalt-precorrin-7 (C(5))-methyltransferase [Methanosarcina acetivorans]|uniref:Precorrin-6Y C5, 15-methyltransferase n=2 Tax=Methanosarcina acetivorans TaxID=2214 RepID=Q8TTB7_METAC|nr:cobalt-precorrin-7 (C(5))-methyltransferase [Methanosarcina acetivorans]AAM03964.1 precorrin-6Y C5, 15-methyltransferase [Methanosarcina acetivorans C2A]HIH95714.1 cobalt-precorrin-7 (C(5))-methyltransferase [Methanosarcina acetivorans]
MIVVGVGVGPGMLTEEGIRAIRKASVVYGAKRALEIAQEYITCEAKTIKDYKSLHLLPADSVVLSTGDPMFSGLGKFAGEKDTVIPGISSMQAACARTKVNLTNICAITAHGRDFEPAKAELIRELKNGRNIFLLPEEAFGPREVAEILKELEIDAELYTCENLGYPEERIAKGTPDKPPIAETILYGLLVVQKR